MKYYAGFDIGGTRIKLGIVSEKGEVLVLENEETSKEKEVLLAQIKSFVKRHQLTYPIAGAGLSLPGVVSESGYMITSGAVKCFLHCNMKQEVEAMLHCPVHIENDSKCAAIAEKWIGAAVNLSDFVCITLGTAVGGAVYIHGELYRGFSGLAGDLGIMLMGRETGSYSEQSVSAHAGVVAGLCRNYSYAKKEKQLDARVILTLAKQGDALAASCVQEFYHDVAVLLLNITGSIAPQQILIGGGISNNADAMQGIKEAFSVLCQEYHVMTLLPKPEILPCALHNNAGIIGAVYPLIQTNASS